MSPDELVELYETFTREAIRVEARQHYVVPGDRERQDAFEAGRPLQQRPGKQATLDLVRDAVAAGKTIGRVRIVEYPLTPYTRYEVFGAYPENADAGETVLIADRSAHPELAAIDRDFVLFDQAIVAWYDYTPDGQLIGYERGTEDEAAWCRDALAWAREVAVPLDVFTLERAC